MKRITRNNVVFAMHKDNSPKISLNGGERLLVETEDCFSYQIRTEQDILSPEFDYSRVNPATGPIFINDCRPGDALKVNIRRIDLHSQGVIVAYPGWGPLGDKIKASLTKVVPVDQGQADFNGLRIPLRPMIGVIGVAPQQEAVACGAPGAHGGNLDTIYIGEGASVFFPVFVEGALLSLGDVHAAMGDGEVCGTGVEIRAEVEIEVEVLKNRRLSGPLVQTQSDYFVLASHEKIDEAIRGAVQAAVTLLQAERNLSWIEAYMLASIATDLQISQVVNPLKTARIRVPRRLVGKS